LVRERSLGALGGRFGALRGRFGPICRRFCAPRALLGPHSRLGGTPVLV